MCKVKNFYCQNKSGREDFSIEHWNEQFHILNDLGLDMPEDPLPCTEQCEECINIVLDTQTKNKKLWA